MTEQGVVGDFLARVRVGPAGFVIEGEAGIGKTTLWSDAVERAAAEGFRLLSARAAIAEARLTFGVLADLLDDVDEAVISRLPPVQRVALDRVLLRGDEGPATDERVAAAAFRSVLELLAVEAPVLVAIDDVQWLDPPSQTVVNYATRRLAGRVGVLVTARTDDANAPDLAAWLQLPHHAELSRSTVTPLSLGALHKVIAAKLGRTLPRSIVTRVHEVSGGNPFYALELTRTLDANVAGGVLALPGSLTALVRNRIGALSDATVAVLLAVACAADATVSRVASATNNSPERVAAMIEDAEAQRIVALDGHRIRFTHPLLAHGVYTQASAAQRRSMHQSLAAVTDEPEARARHLALAAVSPQKSTLKALDAAAAAATARGAHSAGAELVELAIGLGGESPIRRIVAADAHFRAGALEAADQHLQILVDTLEPGTLRAAALMLRGAVYGYGNRFGKAIEVLTEGVGQASGHPALRVQGLLLLALAIGLTGDLRGSVEHAVRAVADADTVGDPNLRSQALALMAHVKFMYGEGTDTAALETALALEDPSGVPAATLQASNIVAVNRAWSGDLHDARTRMLAVVEHCADRGNEVDVVWAQEFLTMIDLWLGRYADAADTADDATQRAEQIGGRLTDIGVLNIQAAVAAYRGREDDARRIAGAALAAARDSGIVFASIAATTSLGFLEVSLRDYDAAVVTLAPLLDTFDPMHGTEIMVGGFLPDAIEALIGVGRSDDAEPLVAALESNGERLDRPWMLATGARGRAQLLAAAGELVAAEEQTHQALVHHQRLPMPFEAARTRLLLGQLQRRRRRRQAATDTLAETLATFEQLGAELWGARARAELGRLQRPTTEGLGLTAAEQRVAECAAAGLSNRQIAAELFLSPKTVEMNLSRVYRKLGIRSRAQMFARLKPESARENPGSPASGDG